MSFHFIAVAILKHFLYARRQPTMSNRRGRQRGNAKAGARRNANNQIYGYPLPLILESSLNDSYLRKCTASFLGLFGYSITRISKPQLEGVLDTASRSVWIQNSSDAMLLWRRGFFGKGNLSRSEPSWLARQINQQKTKAAGGTYSCFAVIFSVFSYFLLCRDNC